LAKKGGGKNKNNTDPKEKDQDFQRNGRRTEVELMRAPLNPTRNINAEVAFIVLKKDL